MKCIIAFLFTLVILCVLSFRTGERYYDCGCREAIEAHADSLRVISAQYNSMANKMLRAGLVKKGEVW